jgi:hypothetical protein
MNIYDYDPFADKSDNVSFSNGYRSFEPVWLEEEADFELRDPEDLKARFDEDLWKTEIYPLLPIYEKVFGAIPEECEKNPKLFGVQVVFLND